MVANQNHDTDTDFGFYLQLKFSGDTRSSLDTEDTTLTLCDIAETRGAAMVAPAANDRGIANGRTTMPKIIPTVTRTSLAALATFALLSGAATDLARAASTSNALTANALTGNGLNANALTSNAITHNAITHNGVAATGAAGI